MRVLLDGDIIVYRCGFASEHTYYDWWHKDDIEVVKGIHKDELQVKSKATSPVASCENAKEATAWLKAAGPDAKARYVRMARVEADPIQNCLHSVNVVMDKILDQYGRDDVLVFFSCPTKENWRTAFYPEYKVNRVNARKPFWMQEIRDHLEHKHICVQLKNLEADDLLAMSSQYAERPCVIVTIDKDMDQLEGLHYNWVKEEEYHVDGTAAARFLAIQRIMGDSTDNIKGVPGWGVVAAENWLEAHAHLDLDSAVALAYFSHYKDSWEGFYHDALNTALVTLPLSQEMRQDITNEVYDARNNFEATQEVEPPSSDGSGDANPQNIPEA